MNDYETALYPSHNTNKINNSSRYGLQHGAMADTEQQAINGSVMASAKQFKQKSQWFG